MTPTNETAGKLANKLILMELAVGLATEAQKTARTRRPTPTFAKVCAEAEAVAQTVAIVLDDARTPYAIREAVRTAIRDADTIEGGRPAQTAPDAYARWWTTANRQATANVFGVGA